MCFCQYVLQREHEKIPASLVEAVKSRMTSVKKNAFSKSHVRRSTSSSCRSYLAPKYNKDGVAHFV